MKNLYRQKIILSVIPIIVLITGISLISSKSTYSQQQDLYLFKGPVEHIFFHPLIAYPNRAFDNDSRSKSMDDWFVTVSEFKKTIESVYKNGYVLVSIASVYGEENVNGINKAVRKPLYLPKGKKPLILSVDDVNYYRYMIQNGTVSKLILDKDGTLATLSKDGQNKDVISHDNEVIPLLDEFIKNHPDFSLNGAKGIIALTGYYGILGYHTEWTNKNSKSEQEKVKPVIKALKNDGWTFASHGYYHDNTNTVSNDSLKLDTDLWKKEVESLTGPTNVYIYPYGEVIRDNSQKVTLLHDNGFLIFVGISARASEKFNNNTVLIMRRHVDGIALKQQRSANLPLFDANEVIDSVRFKH